MRPILIFCCLLAMPAIRLSAQAPSLAVRPTLAVAGQPFGVLMVEVPIPPETANLSLGELRVLITDDQQRVFYPATTIRHIEVKDTAPPTPGRLRPGGLIDRVRQAIRVETRRQVPVAITVTALFRGSEPLRLQLSGDVQQRLTINPIPSIAPLEVLPRAGAPGTASALTPLSGGVSHAQLLSEWWRIYAAQVQRAQRAGDHPMLMHQYLASMLAHRLNLPWPLPSTDPEEAKANANKKLAEPLGTLALLSGIEPLRDEVLEQTLQAPTADPTATLPLPPATVWAPTQLPPVSPEIAVESMASRVPAECFYLRFGSFANYLWFQDLSANSGGDLAQIVLVRGFNYETSRRMERMLNTRMTTVAKMFGDQVISDMAIIGRDLYMKEGASLGVLFASKNRALLMSSMDSERKQAANKVPGATLQTIKLEGQDVSLLSTPDNRVRSFLVAHGDHVLLTTSRHLAERFLQTAAGGPSLATLDGFRWARQWMPESNNYSVFGYFSPEFFHSLVEPAYQVELRRRLEAIARIELAEVASRAAVAEGIDVTVPAMIEAGLLPAWFNDRADGGQTLRTDDRWIDSVRGARGSFLPIVDVAIDQVSQSEAERIARLTDFYQTQWQQMDPMLVGLRRFQVDGDPQAERIGVEAYLAPFAKDKYGWVGNMLAPAAPVALTTPVDDVVSVQLLMNGTTPLTAPRMPYHLFAGVKDMVPPSPGDTKGLIQTFRALKATPGYLGAYPQPGYLDQLPLGLGGGRPDYLGISRSFIGLYRWQDAGFSVLSFDRSILENTRGQLAPVRAEDSAQVRLRINNLEGSRLSGWVNDQWFERASRASHGNAALLDATVQQLKVPAPQALEAAETVLDVKLNCPLGGQFSFTPFSQQVEPSKGWWTSTAWATEQREPDGTVGPPPDYVAPWLRWFRGAQLHLTQFPDRVAVVGTIDVRRQVTRAEPAAASDEATLPSMNFDLFQLPFKMFGGGENAPKKPNKRSF
ncbi:MAG: hypothetical protein IT423_10830 [Pirellulaceae bacterium]|nr:hypothetical protein [Pirellulaceae bacterium]